MYLMYVDESGDSGLNILQTKYFILSGLVVHESDWRRLIDCLVAFRKTIRDAYGLPLRVEIHAMVFIRKMVCSLPKHERLAILRNFIDELAKIDYISFTNIVIDKEKFIKYHPDGDIFTTAWKYLFQRFENTLLYGNFPGAHSKDYGIIFTDNTDGGKLTRLVRKMNVYNPISDNSGIGYANKPIRRIIEDPHGQDSKSSLPIQACDVCAYMLMQYYSPNKYMLKQRGNKYFLRLRRVLNLRASTSNSLGIVEY